MSQSPGMMAEGRPLGLGCSPCASLGGGVGGLARIGVFGCAPGAPRRRGMIAEGRPLGLSFERRVRCCGRLEGVVRLGVGFFRFREVVAWRG